jgi:GMP synthase-like glutamine amidotransferase
MLLIITNETPNSVNSLNKVYDTLKARDIPYEIISKCDPAIIRRNDIRGFILPGSMFRIHPYKVQPELELQLYYLFHFPKMPVLGICGGCQLLMLYYGGEFLSYNSYWIHNTEVELNLSRYSIFHGEERRQKIHVHFHDLPVMTPEASKAGVREIAWITRFRDGKRRACAFEFVKDRIYGFMFHAEANKETQSILYNFYDRVCS